MSYKNTMIGGLSALLLAGAMAGCQPTYDAKKAEAENAKNPVLKLYNHPIPSEHLDSYASNKKSLEKKVELTPEEKKKLDTIGIYDRLLKGKTEYDKLNEKEKEKLLLIGHMVEDPKKVVEICYEKDRFEKFYNGVRPEQKKLSDSFLLEMNKEKFDTNNLSDRILLYTLTTSGSSKEQIDAKFHEISGIIAKNLDITPIANIYLGILNGFQKAVGK